MPDDLTFSVPEEFKQHAWVDEASYRRDYARSLADPEGSGWVAKRIAEALPRIEPSPIRSALQKMHESHLANIARCEQLLV
jgi:hypothetical protein